MAKAQNTRKSTAKPSTLENLGPEMRQLAVIRGRFAPLPEPIAAGLLGSWSEGACRARGENTRGVDTFPAGMNWARTLSTHANDPAVNPVHARWFLDCLTALGRLLGGVAETSDPSWEAKRDDAQKRADARIARVVRRARELAGDDTLRTEQLAAALAPVEGKDPRITKLERLAALLTSWRDALGPVLDAKGLGTEACDALRADAKALGDLTAVKPAPKQIQALRDAPAVNIAEGRLLYAMRAVWDDFAEAREDGTSALQLTVTPALLRGLDMYVRKAGDPAAPTP